MNERTRFALALATLASAAGACGDDQASDGGVGQIEVTVYGESFIEDGIPASEVSDGWAVSFDLFQVTVRDVTAGGAPLAEPEPVDLAQSSAGKGHVLGSVEVPAGSHDDASYTLSKLHVQGRATKGAETKSFDWTFDEPVHYAHCETATKVDAEGKATFQITVHADHFLYDSLVSEEPTVAFSAFAEADSNGDGLISQDELLTASIGGFDPGNDDEIEDLWSWLVALSRTLGHVDGEGHCAVESK